METILLDFISRYNSLSKDEKCAIKTIYKFQTLKKGTIFLEEGQYSNEGYFILKGCIRIYYIINGEEKTTAFYSEMEAFTLCCVVNKQPSNYFITCVEDSIVSIANHDLTINIFEQFPKFETLYRVLSEEILAKSRYVFDKFKTSSPEQRYLSLLKNRPDLLQRVPQH